VEGERATEPARDPLHPPVIEQAQHVDPGDQPVARPHQQPPAQLGADAPTPERRLDRDRQLGRGRPSAGDRLRLPDRARHAVDEAAEHHEGGPVEARAVSVDPVLAGEPAEPEVAILGREAQEVPGQQAALARPEPADDPGRRRGRGRRSPVHG
jgi:hypothetical protein